jgi:hypothetical protein
MNIEEVKKIALKMPKRAYTSEKDFQLALAMKFEEEYGNVVCEYTPDYFSEVEEDKKSRIHIDLMLCKEHIPVELKYRTKKLKGHSCFDNGTQYDFSLTDQGAHDEGSYGFWRDVCRIQEYIDYDASCPKGYVVFLTNDKWYKEPDYSKNTTHYEKFCLESKESDRLDGQVSGKKKILTDIPKIDGNWINWKVDLMEDKLSVEYWCYIAEIRKYS